MSYLQDDKGSARFYSAMWPLNSPSDDLARRRVKHDRGMGIDDARLLPAEEVGANELVVVDADNVRQGTDRAAIPAGGGLAERVEELLFGMDGSSEGHREVDHRDVIDGDADGDA